MIIKRIGILYHPLIGAAIKLAGELTDFLSSRGVSVWAGSSWEEGNTRVEATQTDLILSIGGDGNILRCAQAVIGTEIPIVGINLGKLGFMTELATGETFAMLTDLISGEGWIDERSMLEVTLHGDREGQGKTFAALNDIVLARGAVARVVNVEVVINKTKFTTYTADGVITATATGSTGYSLSAGGPILHPWAKEFLLLPILPHLCPNYPLVLPATSVVQLHVSTPFAAVLCIDGHTNLSVPNGTTVTIKQSPHKTRFLRIHPEDSFYSTLEYKLKGKRNVVPGGKSQNQ
ncbi:MAG: NAD(+)/NADH kinase [Chloroflexota bacterium]